VSLKLSDNVFVSNQPKCQPERKTAKLVSYAECSEHANTLTAAEYMLPVSALSLSFSALPRQPQSSADQVTSHLSVAPPPAVVYLHIRWKRFVTLPDEIEMSKRPIGDPKRLTVDVKLVAPSAAAGLEESGLSLARPDASRHHRLLIGPGQTNCSVLIHSFKS